MAFSLRSRAFIFFLIWWQVTSHQCLNLEFSFHLLCGKTHGGGPSHLGKYSSWVLSKLIMTSEFSASPELRFPFSLTCLALLRSLLCLFPGACAASPRPQPHVQHVPRWLDLQPGAGLQTAQDGRGSRRIGRMGVSCGGESGLSSPVPAVIHSSFMRRVRPVPCFSAGLCSLQRWCHYRWWLEFVP